MVGFNFGEQGAVLPPDLIVRPAFRACVDPGPTDACRSGAAGHGRRPAARPPLSAPSSAKRDAGVLQCRLFHSPGRTGAGVVDGVKLAKIMPSHAPPESGRRRRSAMD